MNPLSESYLVPLAMGGVTQNTYAHFQAERERERRTRLAHRLTLHEKAMIRRRKRKRGGPR